MSVHKAQRRAQKAFDKSVQTLINNNSIPSINFDAVALKARQDAEEMKVAELKKQLKYLKAAVTSLADIVIPAKAKKADLVDALVDATILYNKSKPTTADNLLKVAEANGVEIPEDFTHAHPIAVLMRINNIHRNATVANPTGDY